MSHDKSACIDKYASTLMKVLRFSDGKGASETKWNASFNVCKILQNFKKLARVWVGRCQACCGLCHQDQTCRPLALFCKSCVVIIPDETKPGSRDLGWRGGRREDEDMEVSRHGGLSGPSLGSGQPRWEAGPQHIEVTAAKSVSRGGNWTEETIYARLQSEENLGLKHVALLWEWSRYTATFHHYLLFWNLNIRESSFKNTAVHN